MPAVLRLPPRAPRAAHCLVDASHKNDYSVAVGFAPLARLLAADGMRVRDAPEPPPRALAAADARVYVTAGTTPGDRAGQRRSGGDAGWVRRGGGLLLLLDHQPQTRTYAELASASASTRTTGTSRAAATAAGASETAAPLPTAPLHSRAPAPRWQQPATRSAGSRLAPTRARCAPLWAARSRRWRAPRRSSSSAAAAAAVRVVEHAAELDFDRPPTSGPSRGGGRARRSTSAPAASL